MLSTTELVTPESVLSPHSPPNSKIGTASCLLDIMLSVSEMPLQNWAIILLLQKDGVER